MPDAARFQFAFAPAYRRAARAFGITEENAWVDVGEGGFDARFGRWRVQTPLSNIKDVALTGPYRFLKTAGPARLAVTDRGLTFATNAQRGVRVSFQNAVHGIDPFGLISHPELTVTVLDVERLAALLSRA